jgi:hypothetical protein
VSSLKFSPVWAYNPRIANSDAALFYFAGHGMQVKGNNFLVPVDAKIDSEAQVPYNSINLHAFSVWS